MTRSDKLEEPARALLAAGPPFGLLSRDVLASLLDAMVVRSFDTGEALIREGDAADALYAIIEGEVEVLVTQSDGGTSRLARLGPGAVVGEMALLTREPRGASVVATQPVLAAALERERFEVLVAPNPEVIIVLTEILASRLGTKAIDSLGGKRVGAYEIERCIGRGATSAVYMAHPHDGEEHVALKMMNHRLLYQPEARKRFQREVDLLLGLDHPSITRVREIFDAYRTSFLVMDLCDGGCLNTFLESRGAIPIESARTLLGQLASALSYLHDHDVIHRDVKPHNVLLHSDGSVRLADFGLAKPAQESALSDLTSDGVILGTPRYMAPELFTGAPASPASDVYGLGCLAVETVLGHPHYAAKDIGSLLEEKGQWPLPDADRFIELLGSEVGPLVLACLHPLPDRRPTDLSVLTQHAAPFHFSAQS